MRETQRGGERERESKRYDNDPKTSQHRFETLIFLARHCWQNDMYPMEARGAGIKSRSVIIGRPDRTTIHEALISLGLGQVTRYYLAGCAHKMERDRKRKRKWAKERQRGRRRASKCDNDCGTDCARNGPANISIPPPPPPPPRETTFGGVSLRNILIGRNYALARRVREHLGSYA